MILTFPFCLFFCFKVAKEYERAVVFRLGRLIFGGTKGPGLFFLMPCIDSYRMVHIDLLNNTEETISGGSSSALVRCATARDIEVVSGVC
jgi:regulator of protease activity HflC (stomatin/prohibitin superfamily)